MTSPVSDLILPEMSTHVNTKHIPDDKVSPGQASETPRQPLVTNPGAVPLTPGATASGASVWRVLYWKSNDTSADCLDNTTTDDIEAPDKDACRRYVAGLGGQFVNAWRVK